MSLLTEVWDSWSNDETSTKYENKNENNYENKNYVNKDIYDNINMNTTAKLHEQNMSYNYQNDTPILKKLMYENNMLKNMINNPQKGGGFNLDLSNDVIFYILLGYFIIFILDTIKNFN